MKLCTIYWDTYLPFVTKVSRTDKNISRTKFQSFPKKSVTFVPLKICPIRYSEIRKYDEIKGNPGKVIWDCLNTHRSLWKKKFTSLLFRRRNNVSYHELEKVLLVIRNRYYHRAFYPTIGEWKFVDPRGCFQKKSSVYWDISRITSGGLTWLYMVSIIL